MYVYALAYVAYTVNLCMSLQNVEEQKRKKSQFFFRFVPNTHLNTIRMTLKHILDEQAKNKGCFSFNAQGNDIYIFHSLG